MKSEVLFDHSVILERPTRWSRIFVWLIVSIASSGIVWASIAQIEEAVPATGKLEPTGSVQELKPPTGGIVRQVYVKNGQLVKKGQLLISFDTTAPQADLESLSKIKRSLLRENQFYTALDKGNVQQNGDSDIASLTQLRTALVRENEFYQAQVNGVNLTAKSGGEFDANQQQLLAASRAEYQSRVANAQLKIKESEKQQLQVQGQIETAGKKLAVNQDILNRMKPVMEEGALSKLRYQQQEQEMLSSQADVDRFNSELQRLNVEMSQAQELLNNTIALSNKDVLTRIADNQKKISELDAQINAIKLNNQRIRLDNQKKLAEIDSQISKVQLNFQYQELRSPVDGVVFDLQPLSPSIAVNNAAKPLVKIVPNDKLVAAVYLANKDIGFVKKGMEVDVKVESFPDSEFGSIKGKLIWIGSDVLPPVPERPFYAFPAKIQLEKQALTVNGNQLSLQSGMAINATIKIRKRTVMSIFLDLFEKKVKSLETVR